MRCHIRRAGSGVRVITGMPARWPIPAFMRHEPGEVGMEKMSAVEAPKGGFGTFGGPGRCSRGALATGSVDHKEPPDTPKARKWGFSGLTGANPH